MSREEEASLSISENSLYAAGIMPIAMRYCFKVLRRYLPAGSVLEMGPAEGVMTDLIDSTGLPTTVIGGSPLFCQRLRERFPNTKVVHALFENFLPEHRFDNIVMGHVLEHVEDPVGILKTVRNWLQPNGRVFCAVPNARSPHSAGSGCHGSSASRGCIECSRYSLRTPSGLFSRKPEKHIPRCRLSNRGIWWVHSQTDLQRSN